MFEDGNVSHHHNVLIEVAEHVAEVAIEKASEYIHKLQEVGQIGKQKLQAFIGHIKNAPHHLIDNEYIHTGYRINFNSSKKICKSLFMLHNESVNVWSHLIGVAIFIGLLFWTIFQLSPISDYLQIAA